MSNKIQIPTRTTEEANELQKLGERSLVSRRGSYLFGIAIVIAICSLAILIMDSILLGKTNEKKNDSFFTNDNNNLRNLYINLQGGSIGLAVLILLLLIAVLIISYRVRKEDSLITVLSRLSTESLSQASFASTLSNLVKGRLGLSETQRQGLENSINGKLRIGNTDDSIYRQAYENVLRPVSEGGQIMDDGVRESLIAAVARERNLVNALRGGKNQGVLTVNPS